VCAELEKRPSCTFVKQLLVEYENLAPTLDAYIFCMSSIEHGDAPQDNLSHWLAYGHDGRGACLTLATKGLERLVYNTPGSRLNPVIYENVLQERFINKILDQGLAHADSNVSKAIISALVFATPLMKAAGF
jgi:hypothetical protein